jgi:hypothetical protein
MPRERLVRFSALLVATMVFASCGEPVPVAGEEAVGNGVPGMGVPARAVPAIQTAGVRERPCEVLTPRVVSEIMGVPARQLQGVTVAGSCTYAWEDGETWQRGSAALADFRVFIEEEDAERHFEQTYRSLTAEELAALEARLEEERRHALQTGQITEAELAQRGDGGQLTVMNLEEIPGVGDQARYDGTIRMLDVPGAGLVRVPESMLYVRRGNVVMGVRADRFTPATLRDARRGPTDQEWRANRELTLRLAQRVLATM